MKLNTGMLLGALMLAAPAMAADLPDPVQTPGATDSAITQANIYDTICTEGWTKKTRPPAEYTRPIKQQMIGPSGDLRDYELDHLIPLCVGGAGRDRRNLWPQVWRGQWGAYTKDRLELKICHLVCSGQITLAQGQQAFAGNWIKAYQQYCPKDGDCPSYKELHPDR